MNRQAIAMRIASAALRARRAASDDESTSVMIHPRRSALERGRATESPTRTDNSRSTTPSLIRSPPRRRCDSTMRGPAWVRSVTTAVRDALDADSRPLEKRLEDQLVPVFLPRRSAHLNVDVWLCAAVTELRPHERSGAPAAPASR